MQKGDNNKQKSESSVKVFVRVRPLISIESNTQNIVSIRPDQQSVTIYIDQYNQIQTKFDKIISQEKSQKEMFVNVQGYIDKILNAYNLTIFAYGQTGSGKTYTMFGKDWENSFQQIQKGKKSLKQNTPLTDVSSDDNYAGLIPRSTHYLFQCLSRCAESYNVFCSFLQIYNEKVYDLLQDSPIPNPLNIHESKFQGIFVEGLGQFKILQYTDCLELMRRGEKNRFIRQTSMNAKSSRSHTIFQILIESANSNANGIFTRTRLNLCDLAGSQKINKKQSMSNQHLQQLKNINLSLTTLGKVINSLSKQSQKSNSIFRESKLTRLLQQSLVGNTNTIIVGAISPSSKNREQTLNTLKFVERARHIKMVIKPSSISNQSGELVSRLKEEMMQLRQLLQEKEKMRLPKEVEERLRYLEIENQKLKNQADNKGFNIQSLVQENRKYKEALNRMERVAMEQLSNASFQASEDRQSNEHFQRKSNGTIRFDDLGPMTNNGFQSRYIQNNETGRQFLPQIAPRGFTKLNKSLEMRPEPSSRPAMIIDGNAKKKIIQNLQMLQTRQKMQQLKLMSSLETIEQIQKNDNKANSQHNRRKSLAFQKSQTPASAKVQKSDIKSRQLKKQEYMDKIKQLQRRLKQSKK